MTQNGQETPKGEKTKSEPRVYDQTKLYGVSQEEPKKEVLRPTPGLVIEDPIAKLMHEMDLMKREQAQLLERLSIAEERAREADEFAKEMAGQMMEAGRRGLSAEDIARGRKKAKDEYQRNYQKKQAELRQKMNDLLRGPKMTHTPDVDDRMPFGGVVYEFKAGVPMQAPKCVWEAWHTRQRQLKVHAQLQNALGSPDPNRIKAVELRPDGNVLRPVGIQEG